MRDRDNRSVASSARVFTFFILSGSLSQEMFVHNSGARNVIHLFALWCGVLQNIDEKQSVEEMCECVQSRRIECRLWMNEVERGAVRMTGTRSCRGTDGGFKRGGK